MLPYVQAIHIPNQGRFHQERQERGDGVCVGLRCSLAKQNGLSLYAPQQALGLAVSAAGRVSSKANQQQQEPQQS
jgi:hypothetical protein